MRPVRWRSRDGAELEAEEEEAETINLRCRGYFHDHHLGVNRNGGPGQLQRLVQPKHQQP